MIETIISAATKEVVLGFERPFVIIGERINPAGRKLLTAEMAAGDYRRVEKDTIAPVEAGARMLDVNAGIPLADEPRILAEAVQSVQSLVTIPLAIDSSIMAALESGLSVYKGKASVNSVTGSEPKGPLEILPLSDSQCAGLASGTAPDRHCFWSLASEKLMMLGSNPLVSVGDQSHE
jgi:5-methyltetrahydrofolate--homocysteine methyltransferase